MIQIQVRDILRRVPKSQLHLHIQGTLQPELMFDLAKKNNIELPYKSIEEARQKYKFPNLQSFLDIYYNAMMVLITKQDFYDLTFAYFEKAHADGVRHVELFFDPQAHLQRGVPFKNVIEGIDEAAADARSKFNISSYLIMSFLRHLSQQSALQVLELSLPYKNKIKAIGLDSSQVGNPPSKFIKSFEKAREYGFKVVAHAGEEGPPSYIWQALNLLNIERIDHGVRSEEDSELIKHIVDRKIALTMCPLSNLKLDVFKSMGHHNIKSLFNKGVRVTINSDDPAYFDGYILQNYMQCYKHLGFKVQQLCTIARYSIEASFLSNEQKEKLVKQIQELISTIK